MKIIKFVCSLLMTACISVSHAAVIHVTDLSGNLLGAKNVLVDGSLYDVAFSDGTCISLFNGCDDPSDFTFDTDSLALLASQALMDSVLIDGVAGMFDSDVKLVHGCDSFVECIIMTAYVNIPPFDVSVSVAWNEAVEVDDITFNSSFSRTTDTSIELPRHLFAIWTEAIEVPEPGTVILLAMGLAGLSFARYRKQS